MTKFSQQPLYIGNLAYFGEHAEIIRMIRYYGGKNDRTKDQGA